MQAAVRFLPTGVFAGLVAPSAGKLNKYIDPKWAILGCLVLELIATVLLPFGDRPDRYVSLWHAVRLARGC